MIVIQNDNNRIGPVIEVFEHELEGRSSLEIARVDAIGDDGKIGRFWLSLQIRNGRPTLRLTTTVAGKERTETVQGTFNVFVPKRPPAETPEEDNATIILTPVSKPMDGEALLRG